MVARGKSLVALAGLLLVGVPAAASGADAVSTFDSDAQGWQITQDGQTFATAPWNAAGYISFTDAGDDILGTPDVGFFRGGTGWSGDLSSHYGGTLSFALYYDKSQPDCSMWPSCPPILIQIHSPNGTVEKNFGDQHWQGWNTYSVNVVGGQPGALVYPDSSETPASPAHVASILSDVTSIDIMAEVNWGDSGETLRLDNASITGGGNTPEPQTVDRGITVGFVRAEGGFTGTLNGLGYEACTADQKVTVFRKKQGRDPRVGADLTDPGTGQYVVPSKRRPGKYYAKVMRTQPPFFICSSATSRTLRLN